jgi:hypothetical protein
LAVAACIMDNIHSKMPQLMYIWQGSELYHTVKGATETCLHSKINWDGSFILRSTWQLVLKYTKDSTHARLATNPTDSWPTTRPPSCAYITRADWVLRHIRALMMGAELVSIWTTLHCSQVYYNILY